MDVLPLKTVNQWFKKQLAVLITEVMTNVVVLPGEATDHLVLGQKNHVPQHQLNYVNQEQFIVKI